MKESLFVARVVLLLGLLLGTQAEGIVPGIPTSAWPYVGRYGDVSLGTSGVAVGDRWVLTARHAAWQGDLDGRFRMDGGPVYSSIKIYRHPTDDIALVEFAEPFPGWYPIYTGSSEVGQIAEMVGYGVEGVFVGGNWQYGSNSGIKRRGMNRVSVAQFIDFGSLRGHWLYGDFDGGGIDSLGDGGPVHEESTLGGGDSGGPLFILDGGVWKVAGIHSWVANDPPRYGSLWGCIRVSPYVSWINSIMPARVVPGSFTVTRGVLASGVLSDLFYSDDQRVRIREAPVPSLSDASLEITVEGTSPYSTISSLKFRLETSTSALRASQVTQRVFLFNYTSSVWELVDTRAATAEDLSVVITPTGNANRFVEGGTRKVLARVAWHDSGVLFMPGWTGNTDLAIWELLP